MISGSHDELCSQVNGRIWQGIGGRLVSSLSVLLSDDELKENIETFNQLILSINDTGKSNNYNYCMYRELMEYTVTIDHPLQFSKLHVVLLRLSFESLLSLSLFLHYIYTKQVLLVSIVVSVHVLSMFCHKWR